VFDDFHDKTKPRPSINVLLLDSVEFHGEQIDSDIGQFIKLARLNAYEFVTPNFKRAKQQSHRANSSNYISHNPGSGAKVRSLHLLVHKKIYSAYSSFDPFSISDMIQGHTFATIFFSWLWHKF